MSTEPRKRISRLRWDLRRRLDENVLAVLTRDPVPLAKVILQVKELLPDVATLPEKEAQQRVRQSLEDLRHVHRADYVVGKGWCRD